MVAGWANFERGGLKDGEIGGSVSCDIFIDEEIFYHTGGNHEVNRVKVHAYYARE